MDAEVLVRLLGPLVPLAMRAWDRLRPGLALSVRSTGGSGGKIDFSASVSNLTARPLPDCRLEAELEGIGRVFESTSFGLQALELERRVPFHLERPRLGDLLPALAGETTLYGRRLSVHVVGGNRRATATFQETECDPETDAARYEVQQQAWKNGRPLAGS